jgi:Flp pilus assembly protein TadG
MREHRAAFRVFATDRRGASAVEFAIVAPIFIITLIGILIYGLYFGTALSVSQVAAEAARASVAGMDAAERASLATSKANAMAASSGLLEAERMTVTATVNASDAKVFDVEVTYDASDLPIYAFSNLVPTPSPMITRTASIQRGGF